MLRALVIEDDAVFARTLVRVLQSEGIESSWAGTLARGGQLLDQERPDIVMLDQGLPDGSGLDFLDRIRAASWRPVAIMITGIDTLSSTVEAIQRGAYDYFVKPPELSEIISVLRRALRERELRSHATQVPAVPVDDSALDRILIGTSPGMRTIFKTVARIAPTPVNVLVTGESGTGKELVARTIHEVSDRQALPFVAVNCASLSANLIESELFGHARGAFTGATRDRPGRFELAGAGTLMLDEIGELDLELQAKLLRVLEERTFERVGEAKSRPFEARLVCATHRDLRARFEAGRFREDLYFRLRVVEIHLPPLRERLEDIERIATHLLRGIARQLDKSGLTLAPGVVERLRQHTWPGNVRELRNVIEQAAIMARDVITPEHLQLGPSKVDAGSRGLDGSDRSDGSDGSRGLGGAPGLAGAPVQSLADMERAHIQRALEQLHWVKKNVAEALGISRPTLDRKLRLYGIEVPDRG